MSDGHDGDRYDGYDDGEYGSDGRGDAAPGQERTFAALPPAHGHGFARSWWGQAWLKALEDTALDGRRTEEGAQVRPRGPGRCGLGAARPDHRGGLGRGLVHVPQ